MHLPRPALLLAVLGLLVLAAPVPSAWAGDGAEPAAKKAKKPAQRPKASEPQSDTEKDIAELIKRGGKLPDDWRPAGMGPSPFARGGGHPSVGPGGPSSVPPRLNMPPSPRALARLVLAFLEVKKDPVKGPIYEAVVRAAAAAYSEPLFLDAAKAAAGLDKLIRAGLADPKSAGVYREIQRLLDADVEPRRPRPRPPVASPPPFEGPQAAVPARLGGAPVRYTVVGGSRARFLRVGKVPADSTAHAAGLREGDRIVRIDGKPLDPAGMRRAAKAFADGGKLTLVVVRRDDKRETLSLLLEKE